MPIEPVDPGAPSRAERLLYLYLSAEPDIQGLSLRRAARASLRALRRITVPRPGAATSRGSANAMKTTAVVGERRSQPDRRRRARFAPDRRRR